MSDNSAITIGLLLNPLLKIVNAYSGLIGDREVNCQVVHNNATCIRTGSDVDLLSRIIIFKYVLIYFGILLT